MGRVKARGIGLWSRCPQRWIVVIGFPWIVVYAGHLFESFSSSRFCRGKIEPQPSLSINHRSKDYGFLLCPSCCTILCPLFADCAKVDTIGPILTLLPWMQRLDIRSPGDVLLTQSSLKSYAEFDFFTCVSRSALKDESPVRRDTRIVNQVYLQQSSVIGLASGDSIIK
jgi:hypothetical protein